MGACIIAALYWEVHSNHFNPSGNAKKLNPLAPIFRFFFIHVFRTLSCGPEKKENGNGRNEEWGLVGGWTNFLFERLRSSFNRSEKKDCRTLFHLFIFQKKERELVQAFPRRPCIEFGGPESRSGEIRPKKPFFPLSHSLTRSTQELSYIDETERRLRGKQRAADFSALGNLGQKRT